MRKEIVEKLKNNGVGILLTDTIYGLVGSALSKKVIKRIYSLRQRNSQKPMIILISCLNDLKLFGVKTDGEIRKHLLKLWPGKISVILPCSLKKFEYLHRGSKTLAFRLPFKKELVNLIKQTGPLVAPSANPEGLAPAENIEQARKYFGQKVNFYLDAGKSQSLPSTLIQIINHKIVVLRKGAGKINNFKGLDPHI